MSSKEFEMFVGQADRLASQGRLEEAVDMYQRALQIEPHDAVVRHNVINIYIKSGEFESAVSEYLTWAKVCQDRGFVDDALAVYQELITLENQVSKKSFLMGQRGAVGDIIRDLVSSVRGDVFYNVGVLLQAKGVMDDSIEYLKACLELSPPESSARVHMVLGQAYMKKGMDKEAVGEFQEVVRLAPMDAAYAYEMLGEIYIRGGRTPQGTIVWFRNASELYLKNNQIVDAIRVFERILNFDSRNKDVLGTLGDIYSQRGQMDKAVEVCLKLASIYADEGFLDKVVGLYEKLIDWLPENSDIRKKLIGIYRDILKRDPGNLSARHKLISLLLNDGSAEEAIPEFLLLASTYLEKGMLQEGISVCEKMLDIDPENLKANEILGEIYFLQGETDIALDQYLHVVKLLKDMGNEDEANKLNKELVKKFPQQIELYYRQAIEERDKGNLSNALGILDSIIRDNPSYKPAIFVKADIMARQDHWDDALAEYKKLLELEPNYIEVRKILLDKFLSDGDLDKAMEEASILGNQLFAKGDYREVENLYRRLLTYLPDDPELRVKICEVQAARGHIEKAVTSYLIIFEIYRRKNDIDNAISMCEKIAELSPDNLFVKKTLASLYKDKDPKEAIKRYSAIAALYSEKNLDSSAAEMLQAILEISPAENKHRQQLIDIYIKQLHFDEATEHYRYLLMDFLNSEEHTKARETVKEIIALQPFNLEMREELGRIYLDYNLVSEAMEILEDLVHHYVEKDDTKKIIELTKSLEELAYRQGNRSLAWDYSTKAAELYYKEKQLQLALDEYISTLKQMLEYDEYDREASVFSRLEEIYTKEKKLDDGVECFEKIVHDLFESGDVEKSLLLQEQVERIYEKKGDFDKALEVLGFLSSQYEDLGNLSESIRLRDSMAAIYTSLNRVDDIVENYFMMIDLVLKQDLPSEACEFFEKIEEWKNNNAECLLRMAQILFNTGNMQESLPYFERLLEIDAESYPAMSHLAIIHASNSNYDQSIIYATKILTRGLISSVIKAYRKLVFDNSSEGEAHMNLGRFYESMGFLEEAVFEYRAASENEKTHIPALNHIGSIFLKQKFYNLAVTQFQRILDEDSDDEEHQQDTRYNLATAYNFLEQYEDALNMYQECYAVDIRYRDVAQKIGELAAMIE